jgi:RNA-directed DNA polymerase
MSSVTSALAAESGLAEPSVAHLIRTAQFRYKVYKVPKRNGSGMRTIAQPSREIKRLQSMSLELFLRPLPVHDAAHAYVRGRGIRTNASAHAKSRYLLKLDFADFFPSIQPEDFAWHINKYLPSMFGPDEVRELGRLLFWLPKGEHQPRLSIGAPSSPFISNSLLFDVDVAISMAARNVGATYTRYADDLTFSTSIAHSLDHMASAVREIVRAAAYPRLTLNEAKTVYASMRGRREVTGMVIANGGAVSLGRDRKRKIRAMYHKHRLGQLNDKEEARLNGLLAFANDIEPQFLERLRRRQQNLPL